MGFQVTEVSTERFPDPASVRDSLASFGLPDERIVSVLQSFVCDAPVCEGEGYQKQLARSLEVHLERSLSGNGVSSSYSKEYSPQLGERADLRFITPHSDRGVHVEIEFRPNVEKDLVKFQIGHNCDRLAVAVLILANDRDAINPGYTSMPLYRKFVRVIRELRPTYPLLLCGFSGRCS